MVPAQCHHPSEGRKDPRECENNPNSDNNQAYATCERFNSAFTIYIIPQEAGIRAIGDAL